jgi:hypothetical protein
MQSVHAVHQPLWGLLVEIEDVLHNIISRKTLNRHAVSTRCAPTSARFASGNWGHLTQHNISENIKQACSQYKRSAAIFSSGLHICPIHSFSSRFDSTMEYQTGAYIVMLYFLTLLFSQLPIYHFSNLTSS